MKYSTYLAAILLQAFLLITLIQSVRADCEWFATEEDIKYNGRSVKLNYDTQVQLTPAWPLIYHAMDKEQRNELFRMTLEQQTILFTNGPTVKGPHIYLVQTDIAKIFYALQDGPGSCKVGFADASKTKVLNAFAFSLS